jgi:hypothetical protein
MSKQVQSNSDASKTYTASDLARLFGVATCTIYESVRLGNLERQGIRTYRLGRNTIRFSKEEVDRALGIGVEAPERRAMGHDPSA